MRRMICLILLLFFSAHLSVEAQRLFKKRKAKKENQETPVEENKESDESGEEVNIEKDPDLDEVEPNPEEAQKTLADTTKKEDESFNLKEKKGPGKFFVALEKLQFNVSSGYGLTRWRSQSFDYNDTATIKYKGTGLNVPLHLQILYDFGKIRFGGGASMELYFMKKLKPSQYENIIPDNHLKGIGTFKKYYGHLGYKYFQNRMYTYVADLEIGLYKGSPAVNTAGNGMRPFVNVGVTLERRYSEYFRMFLKPSIEFKGQPFTLNDANSITNKNRMTTFYVQWGVSYSIPFTKKCPIPGCKVRVHHYHNNRVYRGNPFQRLQNPDYGEEDKTLIKFRGKNKRRIDPF
jgi:hypothetical protein